jgi:CRP-like cAMP-binding protein
MVVEQGKKSDALYIILTGRARVMSTDSRGREVILATLQPGDYIGEMSLIDDEPHSATVRTEIQTDVLMLGREAFSRCLPENSSMSYNIMRGLVQRLRHADRKIESLALMDVYGRVARSLIDAVVTDAADRDRGYVGLEVDADSPTGAADLYVSLGFTTSYITQSWHRYVDVP